MNIRYMTMYHRIKEHTGVTEKRIQLFATFPVPNPLCRDTQDNLKMTVFVGKDLGKWNVKSGITSKVWEIKYYRIDQNPEK